MSELITKTVRTIEHPEIPYNRPLYAVQFSPRVGDDGRLIVSVQVTVWRARKLPPLAEGGPDRWEKDPQGTPVTKSFASLEAMAQAVPAAATLLSPLWDQVDVIFGMINDALELV